LLGGEAALHGPLDRFGVPEDFGREARPETVDSRHQTPPPHEVDADAQARRPLVLEQFHGHTRLHAPVSRRVRIAVWIRSLKRATVGRLTGPAGAGIDAPKRTVKRRRPRRSIHAGDTTAPAL